MRSVAPALLPIFRSSHQAELLNRLFLTEDEVPMTDLAGDLGIALTTLHREAERLEEASLLISRRVGRTRRLRANRDHPAARPLTELLTVTFGPARVIAEEFAGLGTEAVIIFGSWARRHAGETGPVPRDVDVLVVGEDIDDVASYDCADAATRRLGFEVNPVARTVAEWEAVSPDALVADIRHHPFLQVLPNQGESMSAPASPRMSGDSRRLRERLVEKRDEMLATLRKFSVSQASLFGSVARGTATADSDIDLYVEFDPNLSDVDAFLNTGALIETLRDVLGEKVDVLSDVLAKPEVLENARKELIPLGQIGQ